MERVNPSIVPQRKLSNGMVIPGIGMGTFGNDRFPPEQISNARLIKGKVFLWESAKDWRDIWDREDE